MNWQEIGWNHPLWNLIRYVYSKGRSNKEKLFDQIITNKGIKVDSGDIVPIDNSLIDLLDTYISDRATQLEDSLNLLRTEEEAKAFCNSIDIEYGYTKTQSNDHHQSSKSLIAAVDGITQHILHKHNISYNSDPQNRCIWFKENNLHVTSRNLDGAVPGLTNPFIIWEIKEYWGTTKGGSKMSDAVYECQLVGRELREFEKVYGGKVAHIVFVDGKNQWGHRKSDLGRFLDLQNQGLIDRLFVGKSVESDWAEYLDSVCSRSKS